MCVEPILYIRTVLPLALDKVTKCLHIISCFMININEEGASYSTSQTAQIMFPLQVSIKGRIAAWLVLGP